MDNNKISQGISFDVSNYLIKRLKILVKSRKTFETWWIIVDEEEDTNERKMRREKEEEEEEKGKRGIFGIGLAGREAEEIGKRRWWPHVKSSCCPVSREGRCTWRGSCWKPSVTWFVSTCLDCVPRGPSRTAHSNTWRSGSSGKT